MSNLHLLPTPTPDAAITALLAIREQIATCRQQEHHTHWLIVDTLRQKAATLAAGFVDPAWQAEQEEIGPVI